MEPDNLNPHARELHSSGIRITLCVPLDVNPVRLVGPFYGENNGNHSGGKSYEKRSGFFRRRGFHPYGPHLVNSQQKMDPVDFKPFVDGRNWIVREPLTYKIGISQDSITVPVGFVTDLASVPPALSRLFSRTDRISFQPSSTTTFTGSRHVTRDQSDQILLLAMIEHEVPETKRFAIYQAVHFAGMFAWDDNARSRNAGLVRILSPDRQKMVRIYCGLRTNKNCCGSVSAKVLIQRFQPHFAEGQTCRCRTR